MHKGAKGRGGVIENELAPKSQGTEPLCEPWRTCAVSVELLEGTDEVGLVSEKLLSQDFKGRALRSPHAGDEMSIMSRDEKNTLFPP